MGAMSWGWPMRPSGVRAANSFARSVPGIPAARKPSVSTGPGLIELTRIFLPPSSQGEHVRDRVHGRLGRRVNGAAGNRSLAGHGADVDDAAAVAVEDLDRFLGGEQYTLDVDIELALEVLFGDLLDRRELINGGVVDENVEVAEGLFGFGEDVFHVLDFADIAVDGDGLAAGLHDLGDDAIRALLVGGVIDDDRGALDAESLGDAGTDALGSARDHCDFIAELAHDVSPQFYTSTTI